MLSFHFLLLKREKGTKIGERLIWAFLSSNWLMPWLFHWIKQFQIKILDQLTIWDWKTDAVICKEFERNSIKQHKICVSSFYITYQVILAIRTIKIDSFENKKSIAIKDYSYFLCTTACQKIVLLHVIPFVIWS